jgi:hypothetical protein
MHDFETSSLPELIFQAQDRQLQAKSDMLDQKRNYERLKNQAYLRALAEQDGHYRAQAVAALDADVAAAKLQLDQASLRFEEAKFAADRLENTFALSLSLIRATKTRPALRAA